MSDPSDDSMLELAIDTVLEQFVALLDGCDDDDLVRPEMVFEALREAWAPRYDGEWPEITAGEMRSRILAARGRLAANGVASATATAKRSPQDPAPVVLLDEPAEGQQ